MFHEQIKKMNVREQEIIYVAAEALRRLTGAEIHLVREEYRTNMEIYDGEIDLIVGKKKHRYIIELKNELRNSALPAIIRLQQAAEKPFLLVCQYIPMPLKSELKTLKINYLEAAGNCYIHTDDLFIYINDQQVTATRLPVDGKLWKAAGLKFLFAILRYPRLLNGPYRNISEEAGIALGNVGGYLEELQKEGFIANGVIDNKKGIFIQNKARLIQRWAEGYDSNLRPKEWIGNFRFMNKAHHNEWREIPVDGFKWGGENAAAILTKHLQPQKHTIYLAGNRLELMKKLRLVPDREGDIELLEQFWPDDENDPDADVIVPPLLAYADLITGYDSRNHEVAERIKDQYLD
ncbi:MAG: hypothetical protein JKY70_18145 [Mucilaginibacter sp.]|nr:hypothetical protein [Mucilaginibacter sp.]